MLHTLPYNPEILQAYCQIDRDGRREPRLTAPQAKLGNWLGRVFDWFEARNTEARRAAKRAVRKTRSGSSMKASETWRRVFCCRSCWPL